MNQKPSSATAFVAIISSLIVQWQHLMSSYKHAGVISGIPSLNIEPVCAGPESTVHDLGRLHFGLPNDPVIGEEPDYLNASIFIPLTDNGEKEHYRVVFRSNWGTADAPQYEYAVKNYVLACDTLIDSLLEDILSFTIDGLLEGPKTEATEADKH